jgi:opacity protein-like surface antigen
MVTCRCCRIVAGLCAAVGFGAEAAQAEERAQQGYAPPFNWTGFYVGAQMGGLANLGEVSDPLGRSLFGNPNLATGPFAGGQLGYNYQSGSVVYGLEAEVGLPQIEGTSTCSAVSGTFVNSDCKIGIDAFGALTGRLGLALGPDGRSLIYGKAGAAWTKGSIDLVTNDSTSGFAGNPFTRNSNDLWRWGWTLGAGAERVLAGNWSVKAEYDYASFGDQSVALLSSAVLDTTGAVAATVPGRTGQASDEMHTFKLGVNYRFGAPAPPTQDGTEPSLKDAPAPLNLFGVEMGGRYWYSWGRHKYDLGHLKSEPAVSYSLVSRLTYDDLYASTGEFTGRLTAPWNLFAKGFIGGGSMVGGHMNDEDFNIPGDQNDFIPYTNTLSSVAGSIPLYGAIDVGYDWWRTASYRAGTYIGYNYYQEAMQAFGVQQTANRLGPFGPDNGGSLPATGHPVITQDAVWQSLRLGAATEFYLVPGLKLSGDAAYLPYVSVDAEDNHFIGNSGQRASLNDLRGYGVGTQLEAMLSYDVTDQLSIGAGARYWAMWTTDGSFTRPVNTETPVTLPLRHQHLRLETERAGVLGQVMYKFD